MAHGNGSLSSKGEPGFASETGCEKDFFSGGASREEDAGALREEDAAGKLPGDKAF